MASLSLAFDILARDQGASKTFKNVGDSAEKAGKQGESAGARLGTGLKVGALAAAAGLAAVGGAALGFAKDAAESAKIGRLTTAVIKSTGGAAHLTADQVGNLATAISNKTAVDDEAIQSGANLLLTFTKVRNEVGKGNNIFDRATQAAVDMSVAMGTDVTSASLQLGKALNDPIKGVTALSKAGVSFTAQQKDQIKAMVEAGDVLGAQKIILGEMATQFGGAAAAAADPVERLKVVVGNLGEQFGAVLLPHLEKFATFLGDDVAPRVGEFLTQMETGEGAGGKFAAGLDRIHTAGVAVRDFVRDELVARFKDFREEVSDRVSPKVEELRRIFDEKVHPALITIRDYMRDEFQPAWEELSTMYDEDIKPAVDDLRVAFERNKPELMEIARLVGTVVAAMLIFHAEVGGRVLPVVIDLAGKLGGLLVTELGKTLDKISFVVDKTKEAWEWFGKFTDRISEFKVPGWISGMGGAIGNIAGALTGAVGALAGAGTGDGPGRYVAGGNTLAKVRGLLPPGASITSTYRTPAQNAAVGGVTGSYHTDRGNPAVDIAGSRAAMDAVYGRLLQIGGWRELLYKTPGHWDHVHVAHQGGMVSAGWPTMPGLRSDERPVIAQIGEQIVSKNDVGAVSSGGAVYLADESIGALASAILTGVGVAAHKNVAGYASLNRRAGAVYA